METKRRLSSDFLRRACLKLDVANQQSSDFTAQAARDAVSLVQHFHPELDLEAAVKWAMLLAGGVREKHQKASADKVLQGALQAMSVEDVEAYEAFKSYHNVLKMAALSVSPEPATTSVQETSTVKKNTTPEKYRATQLARHKFSCLCSL